MASNKEALCICLDVSPSMDSAPPGVETPLDTSLSCISMILQRKMFAESKDEVCMVLFGTASTKNELYSTGDDSYSNISVHQTLYPPNFDMLQDVKQIKADTGTGDFLDALIVSLDLLVRETQGSKFSSKRLILLSNLSNPFSNDKLGNIIGGFQQEGIELDIIGVSLNTDDGDDAKNETSTASGSGDGGHHGSEKPKTGVQKAAESLLCELFDAGVQGASYSFEEAMPALSFFQTRMIKSTPWKVNLEIGAISIPVSRYVRVKEARPKSWKRQAADPDDAANGTIVYNRTYLSPQDEEEVDKEDLIKGYRYGSTLVPFTDDDEAQMKFRGEKCLKVLGFSKLSQLKRHHWMGDSSYVVVVQTSQCAQAFSSLVKALCDLDEVAIARYCYHAGTQPRLVALIPEIDDDKEYFVCIQIPFLEDLRYYHFAPFENVPVSEHQLSLVDDLIDSMMLVDVDGDELLQAEETFNPYLQRLYQSLECRALNPGQDLPGVSHMVARALEPPPAVASTSRTVVESIKAEFPLKRLDPSSGKRSLWSDVDWSASSVAKKPRLEEADEGDRSLQQLTRPQVTEIGSIDPVADLLLLADLPGSDLTSLVGQMAKVVLKLVRDSFGDSNYDKAVHSMDQLRKRCVQSADVAGFNGQLCALRQFSVENGHRDFWARFQGRVDGAGSALITAEEVEGGASKQELEDFEKSPVGDSAEVVTATSADSDEDLLAMME